jgi:VanZ family protein
MERFFEAIDISEQLTRGLRAVRTVPAGVPSLLLAGMLSAINVFLWPLIWYLDLDSTREFGAALGAVIAASGAPLPAPVLGWILLGSLLVFTLLELATPLLARHGVSVAAWLGWLALLIDAYTDYPRVAALMEPRYGEFTTQAGDIFGPLLFMIARIVVLFFATIGLELWLAVTCILAVALLIKGLAGGRQRAEVHG